VSVTVVTMRPGDEQPSDQELAERYREAQVRRLLHCYEQAEGHPAPSMDALEESYEANPGAVPRDDGGKIVPLYD
jgi:hypothetical protein